VTRPRNRTDRTAPRTSPPTAADERRPERRISLPFDVFAVASRLGAFLDAELAETGIRPAEYAVYSLMLEAGPRTPSELAAALGVPPTTISTYTSAMLARGDARRIPHPTDGRSHRIVLTDQGRGVIRRVNPAFARAETAILANLDRPEEEIRAALADLADALERAAAERPVTDTTSS
jgi:DNA-binding MarR family transcriptional regulator